MVIRIRPTCDPLNPSEDESVITARSEAGRILEHELRRYCNGQIQGRSFLIAGHRGAGKTTMVSDVIHRMTLECKATNARMRPLAVYLHGPSLFLSLSEVSDDDDLEGDEPSGFEDRPDQPVGARVGSGAEAADNEDERDAVVRPAAINRAEGPTNESLGNTLQPNGEKPAFEQVVRGLYDAVTTAQNKEKAEKKKEVGDGVEAHAQHALEQVILGLHRAVVGEYAEAYRRWILEAMTPVIPPADPLTTAPLPVQPPASSSSDGALVQDSQEWPELAAQFEIELMEDPTAVRLREFYAGIGALSTGILHGPARSGGTVHAPADQGARELVALNGICMAHQRISGELNERSRDAARAEQETRTELRSTWQNGNVVKPLTSVLSGVLVMGGAAAGQHALWSSALLGLATAIGASFVFKHSSSHMTRREREVDRTFIPDLSLRTLDRVLPTLLKRLISAGLAPVLVIDELDKLGEVSWRLESMVRHLKKLMAENVFSCFLTDRGYLELVSLAERNKAYAKTYSYFSHQLFVTYEPGDLDVYMSNLFDTSGDTSAMIDCEVLKWMLRHRSQMHALALNREIAAIRSDMGMVSIADGDVRSLPVYKIDVTLQVAIEHRLNKDDVTGWLMQRGKMRLTLLDALYYISREWRRGAANIDLCEEGIKSLWKDLEKRMNLGEVRKSSTQHAYAANGRTAVLTDDDKRILSTVVRDLAIALSDLFPEFMQISVQPTPQTGGQARWVPVPDQRVLDAVLSGPDSVLIRLDEAGTCFGFRYWQSGKMRDSADIKMCKREAGDQVPPEGPVPPTSVAEPVPSPVPPPVSAPPPAPKVEQLRALRDQSLASATYLDSFERELWPVLFDEPLPASTGGRLYQFLADQLSVLPTTPAWSHVQAGKVRLDQAVYGQGVPADLQLDLNTLDQFAAIVRANTDLIALVLGTAAQLTAFGDIARTPNEMYRSLNSLSEGLKFRQLDSAGVRLVVAEFRKDLRVRVPNLIESTNWAERDQAGAVEDVTRTINDSYNNGITARKQVDWVAIADRAWTNFIMGHGGELLSDLNRPAQVDLIICGALAKGPARFFMFSVFAPPLEDWTNVVMAGLSGPQNVAKEDMLPPEKFALALRVLGFHLLRRDLLQPFLDACGPQAAMAFDDLMRTTGEGEGKERSASESYVDAIVLVLGSFPYNATLSWTAPQRRATMLVMGSWKLSSLPPLGMSLLAVTGKIRLWWDGSPTQMERESVRSFLSDNLGKVTVEIAATEPSAFG